MYNVSVDFDETCPECGFKNMKLWGTVTNRKVKLSVRCMRCGAQLASLKEEIPSTP